ncbi:hypothetical protein FOE78_08365 [Microlunatus elymi]|uniref:DUF2231 domain-containing protein n=1 Tax=Microlunatus elymi TaxID=2596828 RepID=A0A516PXL1_9ACTN|nr:DUF2231 domain-containing protein [Microlunatus elymi]QDP95908.1 hypothetical protein FOE78_08365 [Microlunatus elymi]
MITINGLPLHPLLIHVVVALLPLTALMAVLGSIWPAAQRKFGLLTPLAALGVLAAVPVTIMAGDQLAAELGLGAAIDRHATLARRLLPMSIALFAVTAAQWGYLRFLPRRRWLTVVIAAVVIAVAAGTTVQLVMAADAGAQMVWGHVGGSR